MVGRILRREDLGDPEQKQDSIFHTLRDSDLPPQEKTLHRLADEGNVLLGAGSETTAGVLSVMFYHRKTPLISQTNISIRFASVAVEFMLNLAQLSTIHQSSQRFEKRWQR